MSVSQSLIQQARQSNLVEYLLRKGEPLKQEGKEYVLLAHDSLYIKDNMYYRHSTGEGGNSLDFLVKHYGYDFDKAVSELTNGENFAGLVKKNKTELKTSATPLTLQLADNQKRVLAYLCKVRMLEYSLVVDMINRKLLFQEVSTNNAVFPIYDENNIIVGAELQGTLSDVRFKGVKENSKYGYGFTVPISEETVKFALFFESAVDLLSFIEIERKRSKPLTGCLLVSMAGLKDNIVLHTLQCLSEDAHGVICVDNDIAGANFYNALKTQIRGILGHFPDDQYKDWNEQLQCQKKKQS